MPLIMPLIIANGPGTLLPSASRLGNPNRTRCAVGDKLELSTLSCSIACCISGLLLPISISRMLSFALIILILQYFAQSKQVLDQDVPHHLPVPSLGYEPAIFLIPVGVHQEIAQRDTQRCSFLF